MNLPRIFALVVKEGRQMVREPSNVVIGIVLPVMLLLVFGYGLSLDVRNIRVVVVEPQRTAETAETLARFRGSDHFAVEVVPSVAVASERLAAREADAAVVLRQGAGRKALAHETKALVLVNATCAAIARAYQNAIGQALRLSVRGDAEFRTVRPPQVRARMWFNNANRSAWFLIPGVIVLVMAIIGCMLTSMQMAKEYEHGTIESLFATPVTAGEILVSKLVSNYLLGMVGLAISLVFSRYLFHVPMLGSLGWVVAGASLFILSQMGLGLVISSLTKSQFLSAQISMIVSFLPVFLLSGFLYEIPNMPKPLQTLTALLPARYFVEFLQTAFLVGDVPTVYVRDLLPLVGFTAVFLVIAKFLNPKRAQGGNG